MKNEERDKKIDKINRQMNFCRDLLNRLDSDFNIEMRKQDKDPWEKYSNVKNHTRYAEDARRIRRELLELCRLLDIG